MSDDVDLTFKTRCGDENCSEYMNPVDQKTGKCAGSPKSATSPKDTVRTLPSLKELHDNTVNWTNEQLKEYDDMLDNYRMSVWRIYRLRIELEKEAEENE